MEPQQSVERLRAQSGAFLISAFHERFERSEILGWNDCIPAYDHQKLVVPAKRKREILKELELLHVTRENPVPWLGRNRQSSDATSMIQMNVPSVDGGGLGGCWAGARGSGRKSCPQTIPDVVHLEEPLAEGFVAIFVGAFHAAAAGWLLPAGDQASTQSMLEGQG